MPPPQIRHSILQTEYDDDVGLDGTKPSPQIGTNKGSATDPIHAILLQSTINGRVFNSYLTQLTTANTCHVRNPDSCEFWSII